jgi:hypothetical protein
MNFIYFDFINLACQKEIKLDNSLIFDQLKEIRLICDVQCRLKLETIIQRDKYGVKPLERIQSSGFL